MTESLRNTLKCLGEDDTTAGQVTTIYTIGHSNHQFEDFVVLLRQHGIELLVDVRSSPYSRYVPHANREALARGLEVSGITYHWLGARLGGKPGGAVADYDELRSQPVFQHGLSQLLSLAATKRTAIMCAEGDHRRCHRHRLLTPALLDLGVSVLHIQPDRTLVNGKTEAKQPSLF